MMSGCWGHSEAGVQAPPPTPGPGRILTGSASLGGICFRPMHLGGLPLYLQCGPVPEAQSSGSGEPAYERGCFTDRPVGIV